MGAFFYTIQDALLVIAIAMILSFGLTQWSDTSSLAWLKLWEMNMLLSQTTGSGGHGGLS